MADEIDLGSDHFLRFTVWSPDRDLNPQYDGIPDIDPCGASIRHKRPDDGEWCTGIVTFDLPNVERVFGARHPRWQVESFEPLTLSPSILCECGDHGYVRAGRWET